MLKLEFRTNVFLIKQKTVFRFCKLGRRIENTKYRFFRDNSFASTLESDNLVVTFLDRHLVGLKMTADGLVGPLDGNTAHLTPVQPATV